MSLVKKGLFYLFFVVLLFTTILAVPAFADEENLIKDQSFEEDNGSWNTYQWDDSVSMVTLDRDTKRSGEMSILIWNKSASDTRIYQTVPVKSSTYYTAKVWVKTEGIPYQPGSSVTRGATISVMNTTVVSESVCGDTDWMELEFSFLTARDMDSIELCFTVGGYGAVNSGKAWFDDVSLVELDRRPSSKCPTLPSKKTDNKTDHWAGYELRSNPDRIKWMAFAFAWFAILAILAISFAESGDIRGNNEKHKRVFVFIVVASVMFRIFVAMMSPGFTTDISLFEAWSGYALKDLFGMYIPEHVGFLDYPPLYMYVLAPIGLLVALARGVFHSGELAMLFLKLPSLIADIVSAVLIYRFTSKKIDSKWAIVLSVIYLTNPAIWMNSVGWGQVDSFFTMLLIIELICIIDKKWIGAGISFALMILMKPHGIIFTPAIGMVLLLELIRNKDVKPMLKIAGGFFAAVVVVLLPFYIRMGFKDPMWIINLYIKTAGNYNYASLNAFNFWAMLDKNLVSAENTLLGLKYSQWGTLSIGLTCIASAIIAVVSTRKKSITKDATAVIVSLFVIVSVFTFAHKMHERYMFVAIALAIMAFVQTRDRWFLYLSMLFSFDIFSNMYMIYNYNVMYGYAHPRFGDKTVVLLGTIEFISWLMLVAVIIKTVFLNRISKPKSLLPDNGITRGAKSKPLVTVNTDSNGSNGSETLNNLYYKMKMSKRDWITVTVMMCIYSLVAFIGLGSFSTPQTFWSSDTLTDSFVIDLGEEVEISRINFYQGIFEDPSYDGRINAFYSIDGTTDKFSQIYGVTKKDEYGNITEKKKFYDFCKGSYKLCSVDCTTITNTPVVTRYIRFATSKKGISIGEIAVYVNGSTTPWEHIEIIKRDLFEKNSNVEVLFDEQDKIPYSYDVMNSTYFDEIYHGRTGYEHLMGISPSEKSHPPLGKIFIALGMAIFGKNMFGMRAMGTIFGVFMILLMYMFGKKLTKSSFGGFAAAFLMMFDFMHFTHSRISSIDVYTVTFVILMFYFMYDYYVYKSYNMGMKKTFLALFLSGFFMGCAISVKWNGAYGAIGLALIFFIGLFEQVRDYRKIKNADNRPSWAVGFVDKYVIKLGIVCVASFIVMPVIIYAASFIPLLNVKTGATYTFKGIVDLQAYMKWFHTDGVKGMTHPYMSSWYTWPIIGRPLFMYLSADNVAGWGSIVTMGNPAVWWGGIAGFIGALVIAIRKKDRRMLPIFIAILSLLLPWVLVERSMYIYHYFPILPFVILCTAYVLNYLKENTRWGTKAIYTYFALTIALFILFYPVLSGVKFYDQSVFNVYYKFTRWFKSWSF